MVEPTSFTSTGFVGEEGEKEEEEESFEVKGIVQWSRFLRYGGKKGPLAEEFSQIKYVYLFLSLI